MVESARQLQVTLKKSRIGSTPFIKKNLDGLGLYKPNQVVNLKDSRQVRGMINKVIQYVEVSLC